jgi:hypothetical protein
VKGKEELEQQRMVSIVGRFSACSDVDPTGERLNAQRPIATVGSLWMII